MSNNYVTDKNKEYAFFWGGVFSQWYPCKFEIDGIVFNCAEQYMMHSKALMFNDTNAAYDILTTSDPKIQKSLGRRVKNFDKYAWDKVAQRIVYDGNIAKFSQNPKLLKVMMDTGDLKFVEASPYDTIWGIGLNAVQAQQMSPSQWKGLNWLGLALTDVKSALRAEAQLNR